MLSNIGWKNGLIALVIGIVGALLPACAADLVKVDTPPAAVDQGIPARLSVNKSIAEFNAYFAHQSALAESWGQRIEAGQAKVQWVEGLAGAVINPETFTALGFNPVSGVGFGAIYLFGLLTGSRKLREQKEDSYNAGIDVGVTKSAEVVKTLKEAQIVS